MDFPVAVKSGLVQKSELYFDQHSSKPDTNGEFVKPKYKLCAGEVAEVRVFYVLTSQLTHLNPEYVFSIHPYQWEDLSKRVGAILKHSDSYIDISISPEFFSKNEIEYKMQLDCNHGNHNFCFVTCLKANRWKELNSFLKRKIESKECDDVTKDLINKVVNIAYLTETQQKLEVSKTLQTLGLD